MQGWLTFLRILPTKPYLHFMFTIVSLLEVLSAIADVVADGLQDDTAVEPLY